MPMASSSVMKGGLPKQPGSAQELHVLDDVARVQLDDGVHRTVLGPPAMFMGDHLALRFDQDQKALAVLSILVQDLARAVGRVQPARTAWPGGLGAATAAGGHADQRAFPGERGQGRADTIFFHRKHLETQRAQRVQPKGK